MSAKVKYVRSLKCFTNFEISNSVGISLKHIIQCCNCLSELGKNIIAIMVVDAIADKVDLRYNHIKYL